SGEIVPPVTGNIGKCSKEKCTERVNLRLTKLDSCMSGTFPPYMPRPYMRHALYAPYPICATPYMSLFVYNTITLKCSKITCLDSVPSPWLKKFLKYLTLKCSKITYLDTIFTMVEENFEISHCEML
ncbi:MAG: hypothetical protein AAGM46_27445, partial [Cyanobacteria bacterium J06582_2]